MKINFKDIRKLFVISMSVLVLFIACKAKDSKQNNKIASELKSNDNYVPKPNKIDTGEILIGAFRCSLWNYENRPGCWEAIKKFPERKPVLGWYHEGEPEVTDWEIKYALDHGVSFFVECWFRKKDNLGKPVEAELDHWLHKGLFQSKYKDKIKFMLLWENLNGIASGVKSQKDLMGNLFPYFINEFFKKQNYLKIDGKPVLMIYGYKKFISDLGGEENAKIAIQLMKQACIKEGFKGLLLVAEHHLNFNNNIPEPKYIGFDAITSYHWPSFSGLMPKVPDSQERIIDYQKKCWDELAKVSELPAITTVSMGWDSEPWGSTYYKGQWHLNPNNYEKLCIEAKNHIDLVKKESPLSNILFLDNWNEFGEGHYIFPTAEYGFKYLDAIRSVFNKNPIIKHKDFVPSDIGLGPYEQ